MKNNQIDLNDLAYATERHGLLVNPEPCPIDSSTGKINPHVSQFTVLGQPDTKVSVFHVKPIYYETPEGAWRPLYEVTIHHGNKNVVFDYSKLNQVHPRFIEWLSKRCEIIGGKVSVTSPFTENVLVYNTFINSVHRMVAKPTIGLATITVYPDPHTETTTVDGYVYHGTSSAGVTWQTIHDAADGTSADDSSTTMLCQCEAAGNDKHIRRLFFLFDTSSIGDTDTVDSATLSLYGDGNKNIGDNDAQAYVNVYTTTPASNTALVAADYDQVGTTAQATAILLSSYSISAYNDFTLNATGYGNVSKTGVSKYGLREGHDATNTLVVGNNFAGAYTADQTGTSNDPKLAVVYTVAAGSGPANLKSYNTNLKANIKSINTNLIANVKSLNTNV